MIGYTVVEDGRIVQSSEGCRMEVPVGVDPEAYATQMMLQDKSGLGTLWMFASVYQNGQCDSNGYVAIINKLRIDPSNAKALANLAWIESIWTEYEARRTQLLAGNRVNEYFDNLGNLPHRIADM